MATKYVKHYEHTRPFLTIVDNPLRLQVRQATDKGYAECPLGGVFDGSYVVSKLRRGRVQGGGWISPAITVAAAESLYIFVGIEKKDGKV